MPGVPRSEAAARRISDLYTSADNLAAAKLDGLIVTGREPLKQNLADEPYWDSFKQILTWAQDNTYSTVWSCLAAHAAVQCMDGVMRVKNHCKHCGVLECARVEDHFLTQGIPSHFRLPHSRWNGVPEEALTEHGYQVLSRTRDAGVDAFCRHDRSLFLFFQGHPEYESETLLLEYRRDVARYFRGESERYPSMPRGYFDNETIAALTALQAEAEGDRSQDSFAKISALLETVCVEQSWRATAAGIYRNWLEYIHAQKQLAQAQMSSFVENESIAPVGPASIMPEAVTLLER
jgi:homoserine O-succinyltransferase/O-acetyltransferase